MPEAGRRRRAPPSQIQITFTLSQRSVFKGEREKRDGGCREGEETGGSGERRAVARDGQREDREGEGEAHGSRGAGGRVSEAGRERGASWRRA